MGVEAKYYTPEIEEFHVGFEYEYFEPVDNTGWVKTEVYCFDEHNTTQDIRDGLKDNSYRKIRVKCLDAADIEKCGWESEMVLNVWSDNSDIIPGFTIKENNTDTYVLLHNEEDGSLGIYLQRVYNEVTGNWEEHRLFNGTIKNKSELKRLMKQLGICK